MMSHQSSAVDSVPGERDGGYCVLCSMHATRCVWKRSTIVSHIYRIFVHVRIFERLGSHHIHDGHNERISGKFSTHDFNRLFICSSNTIWFKGQIHWSDGAQSNQLLYGLWWTASGAQFIQRSHTSSQATACFFFFVISAWDAVHAGAAFDSRSVAGIIRNELAAGIFSNFSIHMNSRFLV